MKLLRYGPVGNEKPGAMDANNNVRDLSGIVQDIDAKLIASGGLDALRNTDLESLPIVQPERLGSCVGNVGKFICIGLNYVDHARESNLPLPLEPIVFQKAISALSGPNDDIEIPRGANTVDWEVELGIVIGARAKYIEEQDAMDHIAGFCLANDVSERDYQMKRQGQWTKGKSHDSFGPIGPWLVTKDEIEDVKNLELWLDVNGVAMQRGNTKDMIFDPAFIVAYLSRFMTLLSGDVIVTGTPAGVGMGMQPPQYLRSGDVVALGIKGLGEQRQVCVPA